MEPEAALLDKLEQWKADRPWTSYPKVKIVVVGCEGAGKTTLAYSLADMKLSDETSTPKIQKVVRKIGDVELSVCDTPPLEIDDLSGTVKNLSRGTFMGSHECSAWIYAINMVETNKFEENNENVALMKEISRDQYFGETIWRNAVIVLTNADTAIKLLEDTHPDENPKELFQSKVEEWSDRLHLFLEKEVKVKKDISCAVPVVAAGGTIDPEGMSSINNVWLSLLLVAKHTSQLFIVEIILRLLFNGPILCGKQIISFLTSHHSIYVHRALKLPSTLGQGQRKQVGFACSFLQYQVFMLQYSFAMRSDNMSLCHSYKDNNLLKYLQEMRHSIGITILGSFGSGKTALINSLFYGKEFLTEKITTAVVSWENIVQSELTCRICDTPGLNDQNCLSIIQQTHTEDGAGLLFFCVQITDDKFVTESNINAVTRALGIDIWNRTVVVLTYANTFEQEIKKVITLVKGIFRKLSTDLSESVTMVPAGYHKDMYIEGDPEHNVWFIDIWMKAIFVAPIQYQPMLITWLNSNTALHKCWNKLSKDSLVLSCYKKMLYKLLHSIIVKYDFLSIQ